MRKIIASIDIGTDTIKIVVAEIIKGKLNVLASSCVPSKGLKKGLIVDNNLVINSLKEGIKKCEELLGLNISKAIVSVPAYNVEFAIGDGTTTVTNADRVVKGADIVMAIQASIYNKIPSSMELVRAIPTLFKLDNDDTLKDPKGMITTKLGVKSVIVMVPKKNVYSVVGVLDKCGIKVVDIYLNSLGDYETFKSEETEDTTGAIINLGEGTTTVSVFNKGVLTNTEVLDLGGFNIDNDLSFIYKINKSDAKYLKENLALSHKQMAESSETEVVTNKLGESVETNQYEVSEIMASRLKEILELAKKQINLLTKKEIHYIIVTGGLTEAKDFSLLLESVYGHNASIGNVNELGVRDNKYSSCIGMIKCFSESLKMKDKEFSIFNETELEELSSGGKRVKFEENSVLGKVFGYFFDN